MKKAVFAFASALGLAAPALAEDVPTLVTILSSDEPQTQLMSMVLTMQSIQQGSNAHVLLCGPAGDLALKEAPASATAPQEPRGVSPQGLMQNIMESGAKVEVCALYLPNKGVGADALLDGVTAAKPNEMAARMLAPNTRIMSQ
ncbi:hypothetical protein KUV51_13220 [Tateyamaria omphalii]|uniref:hypothetical protein n=1 Tax=Tateyamaria omphalii TaxID=299262 RepID=UPI001C98EF13|nr:hypothetical protein [Tateyamaria omphalii]MBY5933965.1 hypothetical protein [Tateyamaria omphalii]